MLALATSVWRHVLRSICVACPDDNTTHGTIFPLCMRFDALSTNIRLISQLADCACRIGGRHFAL